MYYEPLNHPRPSLIRRICTIRYFFLLLVFFSIGLVSYSWFPWASIEQVPLSAELTFASVSSPDPPPSLSNTSLSEDPALFSHNNTSPLIELKSPLSNATFVPPTCATSPADPDYNAVILYVVSSNRGTELINSLIKVYQNMALTRPWPIVLFHPGDYDNPDGRNSFRAGLLGKIGYEKDALDFLKRIEFERMHWTLPEGISSNVDEVDPVFHGEWPGYHHMCAFYTYHIFDHPRLQNVTYYLRLDTDSYILEPICYDPIERFHSRNLSYAFISARTDPRWVTDGLWELVDDYARNTTGMEERMEKNGWEWPKGRYMPEMKEEEFPMFYNNFEVVRLERFRQYDIQAWLKEVASVPKRFYKYRWGDAPLRTATVYMFLNVTTEAEQFCGIRYDHNGVQEPQCECVP